MAKIRTHYDNLKVARNAPDTVIQTSYETLIQSFQNMEPEEAQFFTNVVSESYEVLIHPIRRSVYDKWIEEQENPQQEETPFQQPEVIESAASFEYAGFWRRAFAYVIDGVSVMGFCYIFIAYFGVGIHFFDGLMMMNNPIWWFAALLALIVLPVIVIESSNRQASIGKKLLGLKLIDISGNRISFGRAIGRLFLKVASISTLIFFIVSSLMIIFSDKKQGLHDKITDTFVVVNPTRKSVIKRVVSFAIWLIVVVMLFVEMLNIIASRHTAVS